VSLGVWFLVVLYAIVASLSYSAVKLGLQSMSPVTFAAARFILIAALLLPVAVAMLRHKKVPWFHLIVTALMQTFSSLFWVLGLKYVDTGTSAILTYVAPFMIAILSLLMLHERLTTGKITGLLLGFVGVSMFSLGQDTRFSIGAVTTIGSSALWAAFTVYVRRFMKGVSPVTLILTPALFGAPIMALLALGLERGDPIHWNGELAFALGFTSILGGIIVWVLWIVLLKRIEASTLGVYSFLTPLMALAVGVIFLDERFRPSQAVGAAIVLLGVFWVSWAGHVRGADVHVQNRPRVSIAGGGHENKKG
jgi:drug/metabolite transporter (DMT)-like permease